MSLKLVSLTGADDIVDPKALGRLSALYPFVEWAILYFPEKEGHPRNPSAEWREDLLAQELPNVAAHLCGIEVFRKILDSATAPGIIADLRRYQRIQLNINARNKDFSDEEVLKVYQVLHDAGLTLILQYHQGSQDVIESFIGALAMPMPDGAQRVGILFDASKGKGQSPEAWPRPLPVFFCGYAGGLGPDVLRNEFHKIEKSAHTDGVVPFWIDMETGIRTDNQFDLDKAMQVLSFCQSAWRPE